MQIPFRLSQSFNGFLFFIFCFLINQGYAENEKRTLKPFQEYFNDILLVIHYNHPHYSSTKFERKLYSPVFKNIVFYGDRGENPEINIVYTREGHYLTNVVKDVLIKYPGYGGYLFMQDDCIMQFWNFLQLDKNKIWFGLNNLEKKSEASYGFVVNRIEDPTYEWWFNTAAGMPEIKKILPELCSEQRAILAANVGENAAFGYASDFFYLPGRFSAETIALCDMFSKVFVEISIPTILGCLDYLTNWEELPHYWMFHCNNASEIFERYKPEYYWMHAFKFSMPKDREFVLNIFNKQFYDTLQND